LGLRKIWGWSRDFFKVSGDFEKVPRPGPQIFPSSKNLEKFLGAGAGTFLSFRDLDKSLYPGFKFF